MSPVLRHTTESGDFLNDIYLQALLVARDLVKLKGIEALEDLIDQRKRDTIETTAVRPEAETR